MLFLPLFQPSHNNSSRTHAIFYISTFFYSAPSFLLLASFIHSISCDFATITAAKDINQDRWQLMSYVIVCVCVQVKTYWFCESVSVWQTDGWMEKRNAWQLWQGRRKFSAESQLWFPAENMSVFRFQRQLWLGKWKRKWGNTHVLV